MEKEILFRILKIEETNDEREIRAAYLRVLRETNPEDNPEGFKTLRRAYEEALKLAAEKKAQDREEKNREEKHRKEKNRKEQNRKEKNRKENNREEKDGKAKNREEKNGKEKNEREKNGREENPEDSDEPEKTEIDLWMEQAAGLYRNLTLRCQAERWKALLADPVCDALDTELEARERLLQFLSENYRLPTEVWRLIDSTFGILKDREELRNRFSGGFLNYIEYSVHHKTFPPYELFSPLNAEEEETDGDGYIETYLDIHRRIEKGDIEELLASLDRLKIFGVYHLYEDVERMRLYIRTGNAAGAAALGEKLSLRYQDPYLFFWWGEALWRENKKERAFQIWSRAEEEWPEHYPSRHRLVRCLLDKKEYRQAKERIMKLTEEGDRSPELTENLHEANRALIQEYRQKLEEFPGISPQEEKKDRLELGWCLFQNEQWEEAREVLAALREECAGDYGFCSLWGRTLYQIKRFDEALPWLKKWRDMTIAAGSRERKNEGETPGESFGTPGSHKNEPSKREAANLTASCYLLGNCYFHLKFPDEAVRVLKEAAAYAPDRGSILECRRLLAELYLKEERFELAVDECDGILKENPGFYPAYVIRQEAFYDLKMDQQVINDYHRASDLYPRYSRPYLLAAETFFRHRQYEDAGEVFKRAERNQADFSPKLRLLQIRLLRILAKDGESRRLPRRLAAELKREMEEGTDGWDIEDTSEVDYELGLILRDDRELDGALHCMLQAIKANPRRLQYNLVCANIYLERNEYQKALAQYAIAGKQFYNSPEVPYGQGRCLEEMGRIQDAIHCYQRTEELQSGYRDTCEKLADYHKERYETHWRKEDYDKAVEYSTRQLRARESSYNLVCRALIYVLRDWQLAVKDYERALELSPDDSIIWNNLGCVYKELCQYEKAMEYFQKALEVMGEQKIRYPYSNMGDCCHALGQEEQAAFWYRQAAELWPDNDYYKEKLGDVCRAMGEYHRALEYYGSVAATRDNAYSSMADIYLEQGNVMRCIELHQEGIESSEGMMKVNRCRKMGELYMTKLLDYKKAIQCFELALDGTQNPDDVYRLEEYIARCYFYLKRYRKARIHAEFALDAICTEERTLEDYLDYVPDAPARAATVGWLELCLGNREQAMDYFSEMENMRPCGGCVHRKGCFRGWLCRGWVYEHEKNTQKALECLQEARRRNPRDLCARALLNEIQKVRG